MVRTTVVGKKVYLRPIEREDIDAGWHEWINDPEANIGRTDVFPLNRDQLVRYFEAQGPDSLMFAVCDKQTDKYIGNARLHSIDWVHRSAGYGRLMSPECQGKGYGTDALIQLLRYGFHTLGLNRIYTFVWAGNAASLASNERVGVTREGVLRQAFFKNGRFQDGIVLAMLREDFDRLHGGPEAWAKYGRPQAPSASPAVKA